MKRRRAPSDIQQPASAFAGFRFPRAVILLAVLRYGLSYRDLEELLAERGIEVDHVTLPMLPVRAGTPSVAVGSSTSPT